MSYDLFLYPHNFDARGIREHFRSRAHYDVSDTQAVYSNDDTGVYFSFDIADSPEAGEDGRPAAPGIAFNLNYYRPHIFALEAEIEVAAFLEQFDCRIEDPQTDGMGDGPYARDRFLTGWTAGNRIAAQALSQQSGEGPLSADPDQIEAVWTWNYGRAGLQREAGDNLFIPKIVWLQPALGAAPMPCVTWTFGVSTAIPDTLAARVVLVRQKRPALLNIFSRPVKPEFEFKLLNIESGIRLRGIERGHIDGKPVLFTPVTGPLEVQALFAGNWPKPPFKILPAEAVLGSDLIALTRKG